MEGQTQTEEKVTHQGFGDALNRRKAEVQAATETKAAEGQQTTEVKETGTGAAAAATGTQATGEAKAGEGAQAAATQQAATGTQAAATTTEQQKGDPQVRGLLKAVTEERRGRQAMQAENAELKRQLAQLQGGGGVATTQTQETTGTEIHGQQAANPLEGKLLGMSEYSARQAHTDYDEKFKAFSDACDENPALYDTVMASDHPGEAAYQTGKMLQQQKKYGKTFEEQFAAIRKEAEDELTPKIRAQVEAELKGTVERKANEPTNILTGRTASGGQEEVTRPVGFAELLSRRRG